MNRSTLAALVVALMLGSGIAGYLIGRPADRVDTRPEPPPHATDTGGSRAGARRHAGHAAWRHRPPAAPAPTSTAPVPLPQPAAAPDEPFAYRRFALDSSRAEAEACLAFNKPLATGERQLCRLCAHHARGEVGAARGRRQALHRRPGLRPGLHGAACCTGLPGPRRRQARRGARTSTWRWAPGRPSSPCPARASSCRAAAPPACRSPPSTSPRSASRSIA